MRPTVRALLATLALLFVTLACRPAGAVPGDQYTISVLTMSPGDPVFFKFGHNAIWIHDAKMRSDEVYNWGTFGFDEPGLITKFLMGRLTYWLSLDRLQHTLNIYRSENRHLVAQELELTPEQKFKLVQMVRENALPQNRKYRYHYYQDNCSTRVRDVIDTVTDGSLKAVSTGPATFSFRGQTSRLTQDTLWAYTALNLAMGSFIDQPITEWEEMFVPSKLSDQLRKAKVRGDNGAMVPLVRAETKLVSADRPQEPSTIPRWKHWYALSGSGIGGLFGLLTWRLLTAPNKPRVPFARRLAFGLPVGLWSLFWGLIGSILFFFWVATDHQVAWHNENLLLMSPLTLIVCVTSFALIGNARWARRAWPWLIHGIAGMAVLALVLKAMPWWFKQTNGETIALMLPVWVGMSIATLLAKRKMGDDEAEAAR